MAQLSLREISDGHIPIQSSLVSRSARLAAPKLRSKPRIPWFQIWDSSKSGSDLALSLQGCLDRIVIACYHLPFHRVRLSRVSRCWFYLAYLHHQMGFPCAEVLQPCFFLPPDDKLELEGFFLGFCSIGLQRKFEKHRCYYSYLQFTSSWPLHHFIGSNFVSQVQHIVELLSSLNISSRWKYPFVTFHFIHFPQFSSFSSTITRVVSRHFGASVNGTYLTPIVFCFFTCPFLSLSTTQIHWFPPVGSSTGMNILKHSISAPKSFQRPNITSHLPGLLN